MEKFLISENNLVKFSEAHKIFDTDQGEIISKSSFANEDQNVRELLNNIFPPREWEEKGSVWMVQVSNEPAGRIDVLKLQQMHELRLKESQAKEHGLCNIRSDIYGELFDELIRQECMICPERAKFMVRLRDEYKMSLISYKSLYKSAEEMDFPNAIQTDYAGLEALQELVESEKKSNEEINNEILDIKRQMDSKAKNSVEYIIRNQDANLEEAEFLKEANTNLEDLIDAIRTKKIETAQKYKKK